MASDLKNLSRDLTRLQQSIVACRQCPRLTSYLQSIKDKFPTYWCRPVPVFGDADAKILMLGLAPGRYGSNRTGRMFTGDASGKFLFRALFDLGLASQSDANSRDDGLKLKNIIISAVVRCAPPKNKPDQLEINRCSKYFHRELELLKNVNVVIALGRIAHDAFIAMKQKTMKDIRRSDYLFGHGRVHRFDERPSTLVDVYHPSRQNTQTGRLTMGMFKLGIRLAVRLAKC